MLFWRYSLIYNLGLDVLGKGTIQLNLNYDCNHLNTLKNGNDKLDDNSRLRTTSAVLLNVAYSFTSNLAIEGLFTWVEQSREITQFGNTNIARTSGIGDGVLLAKYKFDDLLGATSFFTLGVGAKIPIGSTTETTNQGILLNADLQPGSGAWDAILWSQVSKSFKFRESMNFSSRIVYRVTGVNNSYLEITSYEFGDELQVYLSVLDQFNVLDSYFIPSLTFKYRNASQDKIGGFELDNTGGNWVFVSPALSYNITPKLAVNVTSELPIYSNVIGTQLTPTYRITGGLLYKI